MPDLTAPALADIVQPLRVEDWPAGIEYDPPKPSTPVPHCRYSWWVKTLNDGPVDLRGGWNARWPLAECHAAAIFFSHLAVKYGFGVADSIKGGYYVFQDPNVGDGVLAEADHPLKAIVAAVVSTYASKENR